jgi:NAD-dependent dihydropyrimidine dehydrogenase PreA subunit
MAESRIVLHFPKTLLDQPVTSTAVRRFDLDFNILRANITPDSEGLLVLELTGDPLEYDRGVHFLQDTGVKIQALSQDITRDEERCTDCGACVAICPVGALAIDLDTRHVSFYNEKCIACGLCIKSCPPRAMQTRF